jgi:hypothetical protein
MYAHRCMHGGPPRPHLIVQCTTSGPIHEYLAMKLDYSTPGVLKVDMTEYIYTMLADFPYKLQGEVNVPWTEKLFKVDETSKKLDDKRRETFHSFVMKAMFLCKRVRLDVQPAISFLASRVQEPNEGDRTKLIRVLVFLKMTRDDMLALEADNTQTRSVLDRMLDPLVPRESARHYINRGYAN